MQQTFVKECVLSKEVLTLSVRVNGDKVEMISAVAWDNMLTETYQALLADIQHAARQSLTKIEFRADSTVVNILGTNDSPESPFMTIKGEWVGKVIVGFYHPRRRKYVASVNADEQLVFCDSPKTAWRFNSETDAETWLEKSPYANLKVVMLNAALYAERYQQKKLKG